ncbi:hypothetical protein FKW77_003096 [Venturia effusa]|uniref:Uncharacterized protein n=1 Tax=Venturia effusa TaxID=50376 RepID=A0A517LMH1_9PEZI|nr:hypothetical protein FKW77_003096 [Venturia effusa]
MAEPACPLQDRQTTAEFVVKLFIVHFTTVAAYLHLLSLRKERLLTVRPVLYVIAPLSFLVHHLLAVLAACVLMLSRSLISKEVPDWNADVVRPLRWLLGAIPDREENYQAIGMTPEQSKNTEKLAKRIGRIVVVLAFITQCAATIFLYARRRNHAPESITRVDQYVLKLALAGVFVGVLTIGTITGFSLFKAPHSGDHALSASERTILFLGNRREPENGSVEKTNATGLIVLRYAFTFFICFYVLLAEGKLDLLATIKMKWEDYKMSTRRRRGTVDIEDLLLFYTPIFGSIVGMTLASRIVAPHARKSRRPGLAETWCSYLACLVILPFAVALGLLVCFSIFGSLAVLPIGVRDYVRLFGQVIGFRTWPQDAACPMLWKDSMADWVWALA